MPPFDSSPSVEQGSHIGQAALDFQLLDGQKRPWRLSNYRGKVVVLLFYPKDQTFICTKQMCSLRDHWPEYLNTQAEIVGISMDTSESHAAFSQRHHLPQRLLADPLGEVTALYGLSSWLGGSTRTVIIIDPAGMIRYRRTWLPIFRPNDHDLLTIIRDISPKMQEKF